MRSRKPHATRGAILEEFTRVGREHSDATVLFHSTLAHQLDLHPTDYKALSILERLGPLSAGEIARHSGLATPSVTNLVDRLERKGFVRRVSDARDRRRVMVEPIADRVTAARGLFTSTRRSLARLLEQYSDQDLVMIADFLARNAARLRAETTKLASTIGHGEVMPGGSRLGAHAHDGWRPSRAEAGFPRRPDDPRRARAAHRA
jgi:DNA-binding MarR family transcriptional regulator